MTSTTPKNPNRVARVNSLLEQVIGRVLLELLEGQKGITTVQKVETSRDLRWAKVWITVVDGNDGTILETLKKNIYDIQGEVNRHMETKIVPRISFHLDTGGRHAQHINEILKQIEDERAADESK